MGLILDSSLLIADERAAFNLNAWLRARPPEAVAVSAITYSELWLGIDMDDNPTRSKRRQRWLTKVFRSLEIVPFDNRIARIHSRAWAHLTKAGRTIGPHDLMIAATALSRRWSVATFNAHDFEPVPPLKVITP